MRLSAPAIIGGNREAPFGCLTKRMVNKAGEKYHWRVSAAFTLMNPGVLFREPIPPFTIPAKRVSVLHNFSPSYRF